MKRIIGKWFGALLLATILVTPSAQAAVDMFLELDGIPGESTDKNHANQVDVLAWSWGMSNPTTQAGGGGGAGKVSMQDLSLTKYVDKSSPLLMLRCAKGEHIAKATLYVRKSGVTPIEYIKVELTDVLVSSVSTGGSGGEDRLTENVSLNFAKIKYDYVPTKKDGTPDTTITFTWNIAANTP